MFKIAVLISGGGSNLQSIIDKINSKELDCEIEIVIADRDCYGLERASNFEIETLLLNRRELKKDLCAEIHKNLVDKNINLIILAGFLSILTKEFVEYWDKKIINVHPSLLPKFGGQGMHGMNVHNAVITAKEKISGCTVHFVDSGVDTGEIILQRTVDVLNDDTPEILQKRILVEEHKILPEAIEKIIKEF